MFDRCAAERFLHLLADTLDGLRVPFFLMQGTALGAWRDGNFVPTERDVDLGILIEDFDAASICEVLIRRNVEVETWRRHSPFHFCHTIVAYTAGAKADLVGLHRWKDRRFTCTPDDPVNVLEPYAIVHDAALLETYQPVRLFGRTFNVPSPIETYLGREYGPHWRTPADDHISRSRIYRYLTTEGMPDDFFAARPQR
jgi:hypothetical protein